ncbi:dihydrolipoamide acetyltransferase [Roseimaritima sediminicola]|uniref:dihydrolipoamide acetyltransferase n=1 Tax=Roseimaritima sediminicola TaxID=2662066 RepID=UPI00129832DB|nr:dihydrolipoamide acetyltransferase [Roseimaritima sediminicola]
MADQPENVDNQAEGEAEGKSKLGGKGIMIGFVSVVVLVETALFFFLVPSAEEVSALAEARLIQSVQADQKQTEQENLEENSVEEFELGRFGETFSPLDTEDRYRVELTLFGLVKKKDQEKMTAEFDAKDGRIRHAVRMKIRMSDLSELDENQLGLLQRRILTTCNHLLEDDLLLSVGFYDYQLIKE